MYSVLAKSFGGLPRHYYVREFVVGLLLAIPACALFGWCLDQEEHNTAVPLALLVLVMLNTWLYPYARFVHEKMVAFILGKNALWANGMFVLIAKFLAMGLCWQFALFLAPIGLVYLYMRRRNA